MQSMLHIYVDRLLGFPKFRELNNCTPQVFTLSPIGNTISQHMGSGPIVLLLHEQPIPGRLRVNPRISQSLTWLSGLRLGLRKSNSKNIFQLTNENYQQLKSIKREV